MLRRKPMMCLLAMLAVLFTVSCDLEEEKDLIRVRIFCYSSELDAGFSGWYIIDGESPQFFTVETPQGGVDGSVYYTEIQLEDIEELEIEVITLAISTSLAPMSRPPRRDTIGWMSHVHAVRNAMRRTSRSK